MKEKINRYLAVWPLLSFLLPLSLYLWSLAPSITFYDSGEFATAVYFMGSAHSPGYPLFLLYAKIFTWLPFGNIAFRINLATAVSAALACLALYYLVKELLKNFHFCSSQDVSSFVIELAALSGALTFAVSPRLWLQSNHDKPYPLLAFITTLMLLFMLRWRDSLERGYEQPAWWYATAFLAGLASGAHQTVVLFLPGCLLFVFFSAPGMIRRVREWILSVAMMVAGTAVQLYLPLRAAADTRQNWGDTDALSRFLWHLLRKGYPEEPHSRDLSLLLNQLGAFDLPEQFGAVGFLLLILGLWTVWQIHRPFFFCIITTLLSFWSVIAGYFNPQPDAIFLTEEFYTPLYLLAAALVSIGLFALLAKGVARAETPDKYRLHHLLLFTVLFMLIPAVNLASNIREQDQHHNYLAQDYAVNSLRNLPENAVLFTWGDSGAFPLWYLQGVERLREDVELAHIPHLVFPWYQKELPRLAVFFKAVSNMKVPEKIFGELIGELYSKRPVFIDFSTRYSLNWGMQQPVQFGILYDLNRSVTRVPTDDETWAQYVLHRLEPIGWVPDTDSRKAIVIHAYCMMQSAEDHARKGHVKEAAHLLRQTARIMPEWQESLKQMQQRYAIKDQGW